MSAEASFFGLVVRPRIYRVGRAGKSGMGLFCSSALELVPTILCQAIRWSMPILYTADTGTYCLEERRDGAVSRIISVILCSSIYCVTNCYVAMPSGYNYN